MPSRNLPEISFRDLLPSSISLDPQVLAAADALDAELAELNALIPQLSLWENLDNATEPLLGNLAWQFHVDGYEGFELAETDEEKRNLIRNSIEAHRHKGTRWAMEKIADILGMRTKIVEWWETDPPGRPYTFRIEFLEVTRPIGPDIYDQLYRLVMELKNVRSYFDGLDVYLTINGQTRIGAGYMTSQCLTVYPLVAEENTLNSAAPRPAAALQYVNRIVIRPEE